MRSPKKSPKITEAQITEAQITEAQITETKITETKITEAQSAYRFAGRRQPISNETERGWVCTASSGSAENVGLSVPQKFFALAYFMESVHEL